LFYLVLVALYRAMRHFSVRIIWQDLCQRPLFSNAGKFVKWRCSKL